MSCCRCECRCRRAPVQFIVDRPRQMVARFKTKCYCGCTIFPGDKIMWSPTMTAQHLECYLSIPW